MIFASKNEKGEPAWEMVRDGCKTVTRRVKPLPVGAIRSVQPGRAKKGVCQIRVVSCVTHKDWQRIIRGGVDYVTEAQREGFYDWNGLLQWFKDHKIDIYSTYRIEFEVVKGER